VLNLIRIMPNTEIERIARERGLIDDSTDLLYPTYYNPKETNTLRYALEVYHNTKKYIDVAGGLIMKVLFLEHPDNCMQTDKTTSPTRPWHLV